MHWCDQKNAAGILMPDIDGSRKIFNIKTKEVFDIECKDPFNSKMPLVTIGNYHFYTDAFEKANSILLEAFDDNNWLIIDEAGKLELNSKGLYPAIKFITGQEVYKTAGKNLLIVVRDSLYEEVISFFNLSIHTLINDISKLPVTG